MSFRDQCRAVRSLEGVVLKQIPIANTVMTTSPKYNSNAIQFQNLYSYGHPLTALLHAPTSWWPQHWRQTDTPRHHVWCRCGRYSGGSCRKTVPLVSDCWRQTTRYDELQRKMTIEWRLSIKCFTVQVVIFRANVASALGWFHFKMGRRMIQQED